MNTKTHYDKMAESSTHFTLHETMTTNQSRAVTDDSLQQKQMSSRPSGSASAAGTFSQIPAGSRSRDGERENPHPASRSQHYPASAPQHQYLVNENYDKSEGYNTTARSQKSSKLLLNNGASIQCTTVYRHIGRSPLHRVRLKLTITR